MTANTKIGLVLGLVYIFVIAFLINSMGNRGVTARGNVPVTLHLDDVSALAAGYSVEIVDNIRDHVDVGDVILRAPTTLSLGERHSIELILSPSQVSAVSVGEPVADATRMRGLAMSNEMRARLTGHGFKIEALLPETQLVASDKNTQFSWVVEPTQGGMNRLHLTLAALFNVHGTLSPYVVLTHDQTVGVRQSLHSMFRQFVQRNWKWLWTAVFVPFVVWIGHNIHKRRKRRVGQGGYRLQR